MNLVRRAILWLRTILRHRSYENDMQAEMREHLERATQRLMTRGLSLEEARIEARREFGNSTMIQEHARDARGARWIDALSGDVRFALRYFARHKATVCIIVAVLALGTGANALIFSMFQAHFLRPAPAVPDDASHVRVWAQERATRTARWQPRYFSRPELQTFSEHGEIFSQVAAWVSDDIVLDGGDSTGARGEGAQFVTPNYFATLGVRLVAGQGLARVDQDAPDMTAVMSYKMATLLYGSTADAIGHRVLVNEQPVRVVGVAAERFQGALRNMDEPALWLPLSARAEIARISPKWLDNGAELSVFGRLSPGSSRERATALARQVVLNALPDSATRVGMVRTADVIGLQDLPPSSDTNEMVLAITLIMGIGILILLVAWMNVSSLMVAAAVGRRHEIAVRLSLGASRVRLLRQLVTESTLLAITGGAIGLTIAWWMLLWSQKTEVDGVDLAPDFTTFAFVFGLAIVTGVLFGLSPALHATRDGVANALRDSGTGSSARSRLQRTFVALQIVLSQPLLVLLGTMLSLVIAEYRPLQEDMSRHVISIGFRPLTRTGAPSQRPEAVDSLIPRIAQRPEVVGAVPQASAFDIRRLTVPGRQAQSAKADTAPTIVHLEAAAPGWLALVDVPIVLGRDVSLTDTASSDSRIVIGSDLARVLFGDANPIGRALPSPVLLPGQDSIMMTVVGVYDATRRLPGMTWGGASTSTDLTARVYTAHGKRWSRDRILVRTRGPAAPWLPELQRYVRSAAPSLPVTGMRTLAQADEEAYRETLKMAGLAGAGGALALMLACLGLYGVVALAVQQRTREIGIRIAVGANPVRVARMFLASGVRVSFGALLVGLPLSVIALRVGMSQGVVIAPHVNAYLIGAVIALILLAVAAAATWVPARRAARVDPATTLRVE